MLSKKYKHGDKVVIIDSHDPMKLEIGEVLEITKLVLNRDKEELEDIKYSIITCNDGYKKASYNELIPISEATKVLYAK